MFETRLEHGGIYRLHYRTSTLRCAAAGGETIFFAFYARVWSRGSAFFDMYCGGLCKTRA
jgi:hypothetical protein